MALSSNTIIFKVGIMLILVVAAALGCLWIMDLVDNQKFFDYLIKSIGILVILILAALGISLLGKSQKSN